MNRFRRAGAIRKPPHFKICLAGEIARVAFVRAAEARFQVHCI
jgi:hypothetical protein